MVGQCVDGQSQCGSGSAAQFCLCRPIGTSVAILVALADPGFSNEGQAALPEHLEEIVAGSHPSLGDSPTAPGPLVSL